MLATVASARPLPLVCDQPLLSWSGVSRIPPKTQAWPKLPPQWRLSLAQRRSRSYAHPSGSTVHLHAMPGTDLPHSFVARLNLGPHTVHVERVPHGLVACWHAAGMTYRLAGGPVTLGGFLDLLLGCDWCPASEVDTGHPLSEACRRAWEPKARQTA